MFSFFKRDPLHKELERAKKIKKAKDKRDRIERDKKRKINNRTLTFLSNKICPECGGTVKLTTKTVRGRGKFGKDYHYTCTKVECSFEKHYYSNDKGKLLI